VALEHVKAVIRPSGLDQAWEEKQKLGRQARFLGGGVDLAVFAPSSIEALIDLRDLGLSTIAFDEGEMIIGATATMAEIMESPEAGRCGGGLLVDVLRQVASPLQRNIATFGGTLGSAHPWSDVIPALLVLDARIGVFDGAARVVSTEEYLAGRRERMAPLVTSVRIPSEPALGASFITFGRSAFDVGILNCACAVAQEEDRLKRVRIAVGGTPALARRLKRTEQAIEGSSLDSIPFTEIDPTVADEIDVRDDRRASAAYRRTLACVAVRRGIQKAVERMNGGRT